MGWGKGRRKPCKSIRPQGYFVPSITFKTSTCNTCVLLAALQYRLQVWEAQWVDVEERVARMASMVKHLTSVIAMRSIQQVDVGD